MKHGINIIGPGFKRAGIEAAGFERRKQRNGDGRFAASGVRRGDEHLQHVIAEMDLPNLWRPAPADYHLVDHIPLLGTGKLDLAGIKRLALEVMENGVKAGDV